jgi:AcrR family transcriptional regulator
MRQRARKDEDKQQRRQDIIVLAWQLFERMDYDAITIAEVARQAGLAKGTIFLYFRTKEELFLAVQQQQLVDWFSFIDAQLDAADDAQADVQAGIDAVVALFSGTLRERPALARLLAMLPGVLEHNIDFETALQFKRLVFAHMMQTGTRLERRLPFLQPGQGARLIQWLHVLVIGFQQMTDAAPVLREVLQQPDLRGMDIDFTTEMTGTFRLLLSGLAQQDRRGTR